MLGVYAGLIGLNGLGPSDALGWQLSPLALSVLGLALAGMYAVPALSRRLRGREDRRGGPREGGGVPASAVGARLVAVARAAVVPAFLLAILKLAADSFTPFLYFQF